MKNKNNIKFCKKCLYSTFHPLGLTINNDGICSGCEVHDEKNQINWNEKWSKLEKIVKPYKSKKKKNYDCIVPVSGAQDSYFIIYNVLKLGLKPLLVSYNKYFNTELGIKNLANLRIKFDCDILYQNVNPLSVKKITKYTFSEYGNIYWPILAGNTVYPVQVAVKYDIPLIIWGAHQGMEQVGMFSHHHEVEMTRRYRNDHDLFSIEAEDLLKISNNLNENDIFQYIYPDDNSINKIGVRGIYLNNFIRWDPLNQHIKMVEKFNYQNINFSRTFDTYDYVDCYNYMNLHDYLKLCKHGYSKVTDHVCREIRHSRLNKSEGLELVRKYENINPKYIDNFCKWIGIRDTKSFWYIVNRFKNKIYWKENDIDSWEFKGLSMMQEYNEEEVDRNKLDSFLSLFKSENIEKIEEKSKYITFGKGWPI